MIWSPIHINSPTSKNLTLEEVEIAKISLNAFIVNKSLLLIIYQYCVKMLKM